MKAHPGVIEAHSESHPGDIEAHPGVIGVHAGAKEAHPGLMKVHLRITAGDHFRVVEAHSRVLNFFVENFVALRLYI